MVKHPQTIQQQQLINCLSVFDHFVELGPKGLNIVGSESAFLKTLGLPFT